MVTTALTSLVLGCSFFMALLVIAVFGAPVEALAILFLVGVVCLLVSVTALLISSFTDRL